VIDKIVAKLKTGDIKNVIPFGNDRPPAPYVVVGESYTARGVEYSVWAHFKKGQQLFLEDYMREDLSDLLDGFSVTTRHGNHNKLESLTDFGISGIITNNDDGTISRERRFLMPSILF
jgi:hypothetical protein